MRRTDRLLTALLPRALRDDARDTLVQLPPGRLRRERPALLRLVAVHLLRRLLLPAGAPSGSSVAVVRVTLGVVVAVGATQLLYGLRFGLSLSGAGAVSYRDGRASWSEGWPGTLVLGGLAAFGVAWVASLLGRRGLVLLLTGVAAPLVVVGRVGRSTSDGLLPGLDGLLGTTAALLLPVVACALSGGLPRLRGGRLAAHATAVALLVALLSLGATEPYGLQRTYTRFVAVDLLALGLLATVVVAARRPLPVVVAQAVALPLVAVSAGAALDEVLGVPLRRNEQRLGLVLAAAWLAWLVLRVVATVSSRQGGARVSA